MSSEPESSPKSASSSATPSVSRSLTRTGFSASDRMVGRSIAKCRLLKRLGRGGMGDVYLAEHQEMQKTVAIKILPPDLVRHEEIVARFRREAISAARLEHPNLVAIYDVGEDEGYHFITMEYVDGKNLQNLIDEQGRVEPREAARIAMETAHGLQAVHEGGIIHRDIKPANILITPRGQIKIVDFGLAFDAEDSTAAPLTMMGAIMGTPHYLSPEQADGKRATERSDLYSLGVVLYTMVTGERPFTGESHMSVLFKQIHEKPRDPRDLHPAVPKPLSQIILRLLEKKPENRHASAAELAIDLEQMTALGGGAGQSAGSAGKRSPLWRRFLGTVAAGGIAFALPWAAARWVRLEKGLFPPPPSEETARPAPPAISESAALTDGERKLIAARDYAPVLQRLFGVYDHAPDSAAKRALAKTCLRLASAHKVVSEFRAMLTSEKQAVLKTRDGRSFSFLPSSPPVPLLHADSIVEHARKSRGISELDLAFFLLVDGEARAALDHVFDGDKVRPECAAHLDDIVEAALAQPRDAKEILRRLGAAKVEEAGRH